MAVASGPARVVTLGRPLLLAGPLEHRRIQVQEEPVGRTHDHPQEPDPERPPELLDGALGKAME